MLMNAVLVVILVICMITDILHRKIFNKVVFPSLIIALCFNLFYNGFGGLQIYALGFLAGFGIFLVPFLLGWIGAGDLKLVAVIGAFKGYEFAIYASLLIATVGAIFSLIYVVKNKQFKVTMIKIGYFLSGFFVHKKNLSSYSQEMASSTIPYGVAICIGGVLTIFAEKAMFI